MYFLFEKSVGRANGSSKCGLPWKFHEISAKILAESILVAQRYPKIVVFPKTTVKN